MPRDYTAVFDDGTSYLVEGVPDDVHPNDALAKVERNFGKSVKEFVGHGRGFLGETKEVAKDLARGAGKTLAFLGEGAAAANDVEHMRYGKPEDYTLATKAVEQVLPTPKNDTPARQYVRSGLEGAGGAMMGPGVVASPARTLISGMASGLGAETGSRLTEGNPLGSLLGGLAGGSAVGLATAPKTTRAALAKQTMEGVSESDLAMAQKIMDEARKSGINLNLSQAMPTASNIDKLTEILANSKNGKEIVRQLRSQPRDVSFAMEGEMKNLPGQVQEPQAVANRVQDATTDIIKSVKEARTSLVSPLYNNAGDLGSKAPQDLGRTIDSFVAQDGISPAVAKAALALKNDLLTHPIKGTPTTSAADIKAVIDSNLSGVKFNQLNPLDPKEQGQLKYLVNQLYGQLGTKSPIIKAANDVYSQVTQNVVDPLKKSVVGRMATPAGAQADREATKGKVFGVLDAGSIPGAPTSEILTLERSLRNGKQPEVFQDTAKTWLATKVSEAAAKVGNRPSEGVAANLERVFTGNDIKQQGFKDVLVGLARSQGLPDDALLPGMQNLMRYVGAAARRPAKVAGVTADDLEQASRNRITGGVGNFSAVQPIRQPFKVIDDWLNADAYGFMDKLLTSPEGVDTLRKLGKQPIMSKAAADTINTFLATNAAQPEPK
jgi:hypothetical protein